MQVHFEDRESWRSWLEENYDKADVVWLVYDKKHTKKKCVSYNEAVEEALCFGWIDSIIKRIDENQYQQKFSPRTNNGKWSDSNLKRMEKLIASGKMTEAGLIKFKPSNQSENQTPPKKWEVPDLLTSALAENNKARLFFEQLAPSYRKRYIGWITSAKREETQRKRVEEVIILLEQGVKQVLK